MIRIRERLEREVLIKALSFRFLTLIRDVLPDGWVYVLS